MSDRPIEILNAREDRRRWSLEEKLRIVAESDEPGGAFVPSRGDLDGAREVLLPSI